MTRLISVSEVAQRLSIPKTSAYDLIRQNLLPCVYVGRSIRVDAEVLEAWIAKGGSRWEGGWKKLAD